MGSARHLRVTASTDRPTASGDVAVTPGADGADVDLNRWFDHVPRLTIDVGHRRLPVFRSLGVLGFQVALVVAVLVSLLNAVPLATTLGLSAVAGLSFFAWGLLRRAVTGHEALVLTEHVWIAFGAGAGFLWLSGGPIVAGLDVLAVSLCAFLAFGRVGCATAGCCHGVPAGVGLAYGPDHGLPPRFTGRRLLPVQLVEAAGLVAVGVVGLALAAGRPGRATVWFLAAYAVLRFGCEALRGDARPTVLHVSLPRLMSVAQLGAAMVAAEAWLVSGPPGRAVVVAVAVLVPVALAGVGLNAARSGNPLVAADHLDELWLLLTALAPGAHPTEPVVARTSLGVTVALTGDARCLHVSLSHVDHPTFPVAVALGPAEVTERRGVTHLALEHQGWAGTRATATASGADPDQCWEAPGHGRRSEPHGAVELDTGYFGRPGPAAADAAPAGNSAS